MSRKSILLILFLVISVALVMAAADKKLGEETIKCPVSGKEFTKTDATPKYEYEGKTYYFCCEGCKDRFVKDPEKYIKGEEPGEHVDNAAHAEQVHHSHESMHAENVRAASEHTHAEAAGHAHQAHAEKNGMVVDPVCGMKLKKEDAKATYEHNGKTYYFCSEECKDKFVKEPGKYIRADEDIVTCPVSGESFKKSEFTESIDYNGKTYYFCCAGCKDKFEKDPEKYAKK